VVRPARPTDLEGDQPGAAPDAFDPAGAKAPLDVFSSKLFVEKLVHG